MSQPEERFPGLGPSYKDFTPENCEYRSKALELLIPGYLEGTIHVYHTRDPSVSFSIHSILGDVNVSCYMCRGKYCIESYGNGAFETESLDEALEFIEVLATNEDDACLWIWPKRKVASRY